MDNQLIELIGFAGIVCTGLLLLIAFLMKLTKGLFIARFPHEFIRDMRDPDYERERRVGTLVGQLIVTYIPPFFIGFVVIVILSYIL